MSCDVRAASRGRLQDAGLPRGTGGHRVDGLGATQLQKGRPHVRIRPRDRVAGDHHGRHHHRRRPGRLPDRLPLLRGRPRHRPAGPAADLRLGGLLPVRPLAAGLGDRAGVHLGQPRRRRDHGHVGERRGVRAADRPLLLGRRDPGDAVPRRRDDALLLRLQGPLGAGVHAAAVRHRRPPGQRDLVRGGAAADRRHQPLPARLDHPRAAGLVRCGSRWSWPPPSCCPTSPWAG